MTILSKFATRIGPRLCEIFSKGLGLAQVSGPQNRTKKVTRLESLHYKGLAGADHVKAMIYGVFGMVIKVLVSPGLDVEISSR